MSGLDGWYRELEKPAFNPPDWVFGPVWTVLYILMGIALYLIWTKGTRTRRWHWLMIVFFAQLAFNTGWSFAFFGLESPLAGLVVILPLWGLILATILLARPVSGVASILLLPYLAWVSFAAVLNASIWYLN